MDEKLEGIKTHVASCSVCSAANRRVNDFCQEGRLLFFDWAKDQTPTRIESHVLPKDQYDRLVAETQKPRRSGENN